MNDLLGLVKGGGGGGAPPPPPPRGSTNGKGSSSSRAPSTDIELGTVDPAAAAAASSSSAAAAAPASDKHMQQVFGEVSAIKLSLAGIREAQGRLSALHERSKTVTRGRELAALRERMQEEIEGVSRAAHGVKARLEKLEKSNSASLAREGCGPGSSTERSRSAITAALRKKLRDLMGEGVRGGVKEEEGGRFFVFFFFKGREKREKKKLTFLFFLPTNTTTTTPTLLAGDFAGLRARLGAEYREAVERRVFTVTGKRPTAADVDAMIESGESETVFQRAILEHGRGAVADTLADIRERHEAVRQLEGSLLDLHQVFLDMAVLVDAQGEMLDSIEAQVGRARDHVETGVTHLVEAKRSQKRTRRLMCCALCTLIVIAVVIVLAILKPWEIARRQPAAGRRRLLSLL